MKTFIVIISLLAPLLLLSQEEDISLEKVEPPFWWTEMVNPELQLLAYGPDISKAVPQINSSSVYIKKIARVENPNYLFIDLYIPEDTKSGSFMIDFNHDGKTIATYEYLLMERDQNSASRAGFDQTDVLYLLMPDRFSNGDPDNDNVAGMLEKADRINKDGRHGGDIQGILNKLDYIKETGFTGLWINPLIENNNPEFSYHGYAITDFYRTDPRYGTNEDYLQLVETCHEKGLKVVMDMIFNHCSKYHWFIKDLPMQSWVHQSDPFRKSNFRAPTIVDPYASEYDKEKMLEGWFDVHMADLDQRNSFLATYLIQNTIWWIEYSGIDGIRVDTQPYPYKEFISEWAAAVFNEYPDFNIVGEAWLQKEFFTSYFQKDAPNRDGYNSNIPSVTDFPLHGALNNAFIEKDGWVEGLLRIYYVLAHDNLYSYPEKNLIFVDNHDVGRYYFVMKENIKNWKMGIAVLLTTRGIPQIYYGTEILMSGDKEKGHGHIREDFPGGWSEDERNAFTAEGRTELENEAYDYIKKLLNWRKDKNVIHYGNLKHYIPEDNVYVYFRYDENNSVMVALNNSQNEMKALETKKLQESLKGYSYGVDVLTGETVNYLDAFTLPPKSVLILELKK